MCIWQIEWGPDHPKDSAFAAYIPFQIDVEDASNHKNEVNQGGLMECSQEYWDERFKGSGAYVLDQLFTKEFEATQPKLN